MAYEQKPKDTDDAFVTLASGKAFQAMVELEGTYLELAKRLIPVLKDQKEMTKGQFVTPAGASPIANNIFELANRINGIDIDLQYLLKYLDV